jgi:hypothetical protein
MKHLKKYNEAKKTNKHPLDKETTTGNIPCEFIEKKATADRRYGQPFYISWYFKLLV